jgi:putative membrane protein
MPMRTTILLAAALVAGTAAIAFVASAASAEEPGSRATRDYVQAAGNSDAFEIAEAETALNESKDPDVRRFAQQMIQEHTRTSQALQDATARAGLKPPPKTVGADQAPLLGALQGLRGPDFDRAYWKHQALGHRSALTETQKYATTGDNPAVRQAAQAALPIIQAHLQMAERMVTPS